MLRYAFVRFSSFCSSLNTTGVEAAGGAAAPALVGALAVAPAVGGGV